MQAVLRSLAFFLFAALGLLSLVPAAWSVEDREEILVGRTTYVEGDLLRYVPEEKDWVLTDVDAPFGLEDVLYAGEEARAELSLPNRTLLRIGEQTQVQVLDLAGDATAIDVASGQARLYSNSDTTVIKATTPFGSVMAPAGSAFDVYVGDESLEVVAVRGEVVFVEDATGQRYPVSEGGDSIIADQQGVTGGNGTVDGAWDDWNNQRESLWSQRLREGSAAANLLPEPIRQDAYTLAENGRWERVYYDGEYRDMWRPTQVVSGWQPFTVGRWVNYYGDNCWIPGEPFGYLTHHYGSWIYVDAFRTWYWLPPVARRLRTTSAMVIGLGWYPGRVGWFSRGNEIGWVPLAPNEDYYGYRHWGHRTKVIGHRVPMINPARYRYLSHALVVDRDHLYGRHRAPQTLRRDLRKSGMLNQFKPMTAWQEFKGDKRRYTFIDREAKRKPHAVTLGRIDHNRQRVQAGYRVDRQRVERDLKSVKARHELPQREDRPRPQVSGKLVDADAMTRPMDRSNLLRKEIKPQERERRPSRDTRAGFDRNAGGKQDRQGLIDNRKERLQPPSKAMGGREQQPDFGRDRQGRQFSPQTEKESEQRLIRQQASDPKAIKESRQADRPEDKRERLDQGSRRRDSQPDTFREQSRERRPPGFEQPQREPGWGDRLDRSPQDLRRPQGQERRPQSGQVEDQEQQRQRKALQARQDEDRRQREMDIRQQRELQNRQEKEARRQRADQELRERQEILRRQSENEERDRQRSLQRQQEQQQQRELQRRQQDEQQQREKMERRRQQELERQQQEQQLQRSQQREGRQRQEEQRARQFRDEEQQRLKQRPSREAGDSRDESSPSRKKRQRPPLEEEQTNQPIMN
jgi:hypothetical protein